MKLSIVIPAKNEALGLPGLLDRLAQVQADAEVIVVDDGSTDETRTICLNAGVKVVSHPYSKGNGAAIKTGARAANGEYILFMDADGQHRPEDIARLLDELNKGYDMVVGARGGVSGQANLARWGANTLYNRLASWMVNRKIADLTSGFRVVNRQKFMKFLYLLPNGFSYPTTTTMAFFRAGYSVSFIPIQVDKRVGRSHISLLRDGVRFFLIIFKIGTLYSPLKIYFPVSVVLMGLGLLNYLYTYAANARFTNMSTLLVLSGLVVFLIGLLSEQMTNLQYKDTEEISEED